MAKAAAKKTIAETMTDKAADTIKLPVTFKEFSKNPVVGTLLIVLIAIGYLYVDIRSTFQTQGKSQEVRIEKLEQRVDAVSDATSTGQSNSDEMKEEQEFQEMMQKTQETAELSTETQKKATEKEAQIVNQTIDKIVELKSEVNELKKELNSIHSDTSVKFKLLPISDN